tara:strand:- start:1480 stop:2388 length:909 start_codon:yes stop_codon:yes gene_type:complete
MHLNYIIESDTPHSHIHTLHAMRQLLLQGAYAPMNTDLFYDQFLNPETLSEYGKEMLAKAKLAWNKQFDHFSYFVDQGMSLSTQALLNSIQNSKSHLDLMLLECTDMPPVLPTFTSVNDYNEALTNSPTLANELLNASSEYIKKTPLHEHLPTHFKTYNEPQYANSQGTLPCQMERVIFESPFAGDITANTEYAARCIVELILYHGKAPMASHLLYTRMLNDHVAKERQIGINAGLAYGRHAEKTIVAVDRGVSTGMRYGVINAEKSGRKLQFFTISDNEKTQNDVASLRDLVDLDAWLASQ